MPRFFRLQVDEPALTDALFQFVVDPSATRTQRPVIDELYTINPDMVSVLEHMILDGVEQRLYVEQYVRAVLGDMLE